MFGGLPGIKLVSAAAAAASGHRDTGAAWVVTPARRGVLWGAEIKSKDWSRKRLQTLLPSASWCYIRTGVTHVLWLVSL